MNLNIIPKEKNNTEQMISVEFLTIANMPKYCYAIIILEICIHKNILYAVTI